MSIAVAGQYIFSFSIGDIFNDFIQESDLLDFTIIEEAGNVLPTFELVFNIQDDRFLGVLTETNDLKVSFGRDDDDRIDTTLHIASLDSTGHGQGKRTVVLSGFLTNVSYIYNSEMTISDKKSAVEVMRDVAERHNFTPDFNVDTSSDQQHWIQPNVTAKKFVNDLWLHADRTDSFLAMALTVDSKFMIRDMRTLVEQDFQWRFTPFVEEPWDIPYDTNIGIKSNTGFINYWAGYGQNKLIFDLEDEDFRFITEEAKPIIALTREISRKAGLEKRYVNTGMQNDNVHKNYWQASLRNLTNLVIFGAVTVTVSFRDRFRNIRPLDKVMFREQDVADPNIATEFHSGLYIVTKVCHRIQNRQFVTTVELNRESFNQVVGNVRTSVDQEEEGFTDQVEVIFQQWADLFSFSDGEEET